MKLQIRHLNWILTGPSFAGIVTDLSARLASLMESMTMALVSEQRFKPRPRFSDDSLNKVESKKICEFRWSKNQKKKKCNKACK
jgi:hypothetical protein